MTTGNPLGLDHRHRSRMRGIPKETDLQQKVAEVYYRERERERETDRQTDRQRQADGERDRERKTKTMRDKDRPAGRQIDKQTPTCTVHSFFKCPISIHGRYHVWS